MRTVATVVALTTDQLTPRLDQLAAAEYLAGRAGQPAPPQVNMPTTYGELWLLAIARIAADPGEWIVYAITSEDDIPGWPAHTDLYLGGVRSAVDLARPLAAAGQQVVLRHYSAFAVTSTSSTVPLT